MNRQDAVALEPAASVAAERLVGLDVGGTGPQCSAGNRRPRTREVPDVQFHRVAPGERARRLGRVRHPNIGPSDRHGQLTGPAHRLGSLPRQVTSGRARARRERHRGPDDGEQPRHSGSHVETTHGLHQRFRPRSVLPGAIGQETLAEAVQAGLKALLDATGLGAQAEVCPIKLEVSQAQPEALFPWVPGLALTGGGRTCNGLVERYR